MNASAHPPVESSRTGKKVWLVALVLCLLAGAVSVGVVLRGQSEADAEPKAEGAAKPVRMAEAKRETVPLVAEYRGELVAEVAELAAQGAGRLVDVKKQLGEAVKKGEVLAVVDAGETQRLLTEASAQMRGAEAAKVRIEAQLRAAKVEAERGEKLQAEELVSEQQVVALASQVDVLKAELQAAEAERSAAGARAALYQKQVAESRLLAPFDGAVSERYLDPGSSVSAGTPVLRLVKGGALRVRFRVSEQHLNRLKVGSTFTLTTLAGGDAALEGVIERLGAEVSRTDRSVAAEGILKEDAPSLKPGMYAVVNVELGMLDNVTTVPSSAIMTGLDGEGRPEHGVKVVIDGRAQYRPVQVLTEHEGRTAVDGLPSAATVITFGQENVPNGAKVRAVGHGDSADESKAETSRQVEPADGAAKP